MDFRNVLIAIVLSTIVLIGWATFFEAPIVEQQITENQITKNEDFSSPSIDEDKKETKSEITRSDTINKTERVKIENENIRGSLSLQGAIIDDIIFKNYKETLNSENKVIFLNPKNSSKEYFIETGWASGGNENIKLPLGDTIWKVKGNSTLTPNNPVTIEWDNGDGLIFTKKIELDEEFLVEKELLLALMGIETNFGTYVGKMDIISSLATLSFDKRRSEFFTNELIIMLQLIEKNVIDHKVLYGSWAGAFGNFQFMPSTIMDHAIDYDSDNKIDLKSLKDSFASAANYINKLGWKKDDPCYLKIELNDKVPTTLLNTSAKKIKNKEKLKILKKYIKDPDKIKFDENMKVAIITPDIDIIPDANLLNPAYLVFENYEIILKWNRSLRFGLAVCNLKDKFKNEI